MKQADFEELLESVREGGNLAIVGGPLDKGFAGAVLDLRPGAAAAARR